MNVDPIVVEMARVLGLVDADREPAEGKPGREPYGSAGRPTYAVVKRRRAANKRARASRKTNRGER